MFYKKTSKVIMILVMNICCYADNNLFERIDQMITKNGSFLAKDSQNNPIILKYDVVVGQTQKLDEKIKSISHLLIPMYVQQEVEFAQECKDIMTSQDLQKDFMLKSLSPMFEKGKDNVDWKLFEEKTKQVLENFFATTNWSQYSNDGDINVFVTAFDQKTNGEIGVVQFLTMPSFARNEVKVGLLGVVSKQNSSEIRKLLISSVFKFFPDVERIFLHTRLTDTSTIDLYKSWGFEKFQGPLPHWTDLEYIAGNSNMLQNRASTLIQQN